ncbi:MAG: hypothetical protein AABZ30_14020 [Myxococcota bacterium]|mgnify:CR=1 FL=1
MRYTKWFIGVALATGCGNGGGGEGESEGEGGATCGEGTELQDGVCVATGDGVTCGEGTVLESDQCVPESIVTCGDGTRLEGGTCLPESTLTCGPLTHEDADQCIPNEETLGSTWGVYTAETFDSTGDDVLPDTTNHTYIYVNTGKSFLATATKNGVHVFDYDAMEACIESGTGCPTDNVFLPSASAELDTPIPEGATGTNWSSHALGVSPDGQWVYEAYLVPYTRYSFRDYSANFPEPATWFHKLNARTLKPEKRIECGGPTHHINIVEDQDDNEHMYTECYSQAGVFWWDPTDDDAVAKVFPYGKFEGYPYLSFYTPPLEFINATDPPRYQVTTVMGHLNNYVGLDGQTHEIPGNVQFVNMETEKEEAVVATGPFPIWVIFSQDGRRAWTTSAEDDTVRRLDLTLNAMTSQLKVTVAAEIRVGPGPYGLALNEDETKVFVDDKAEGVRAGMTSVHGSTISVIDADSSSDTYDDVLYTIALSTDAAAEPHRPDHVYLAPDNRMWQCSNANQTCQVLDPDVTPTNGGTMTECTRIRNAESFPACTTDAQCPTGMPCDANGKCGGTTVILETLDCMEAPILATMRMPDAGEVPGWTVGRGDPHSLVWVEYDASGSARVIQDFTKHE